MPLREYITTQEAERLERAVKEIVFVLQNLQPSERTHAVGEAVAAVKHLLKDPVVNPKGRDNKARFIGATKRHERRQKMAEKDTAERELAAKLKAKEEAERAEADRELQELAEKQSEKDGTPTLVTGLAPEEPDGKVTPE